MSYFQFVIEFTLNVLGHLPIDWPSKSRTTPERESLWALCFVWPRNHFWYGFWFSLGLASVRFAYAARPADLA